MPDFDFEDFDVSGWIAGAFIVLVAVMVVGILVAETWLTIRDWVRRRRGREALSYFHELTHETHIGEGRQWLPGCMVCGQIYQGGPFHRNRKGLR